MSGHSPSHQLQSELSASTPELDLSSSRPVLKHLNADSSWLLSLPLPEPTPTRTRFNIVIDPWLRGPQVDMFSWFSSQEHVHPSNVQSLPDLNDLLLRIECKSTLQQADCYIDAVFLSHEFTDHCHEATLRELPCTVPVFAPKDAAKLVRSWKHFDTVVDVGMYTDGPGWLSKAPGLPDWVGVARVHTKHDGPIYFHSALVLTYSPDRTHREVIVYTPHGVVADGLDVIAGNPSVTTLALIHGLHDVSLVGARLNLGMHNALEARKRLRAKYWFPTHDEVKIAHGLVASFLKRVEHTFTLAPGSHPITPDKKDVEVREDAFVDLKNGEYFVLN